MNIKTAITTWLGVTTATESQTNGNKPNYFSDLYERKEIDGELIEQTIASEQIEGTPFTIRWEKEHGFFVTMGEYRLTMPSDNWEEQWRQVYSKEWKLLLTVISATIEQMQKMEKLHQEAIEELNK